MSEVKRWAHAVRWESMKIAASYMAINRDGKYVLHDDYEREVRAAIAAGIRMQDQRDAALAECERLRAELEKAKETGIRVAGKLLNYIADLSPKP